MQAKSASSTERALAVVAIVLLIFAAWRLWAMAGRSYHPYSFYQVGRLFVCAAWITTCIVLWRKRLVPAAVAAAIIAFWFNPAAPIHMRRYEWPPYDRAGAVASIVAAAYLAWKIKSEASHPV